MSTNRENELDGLEKEIYQGIWEHSEHLTLSDLSRDLMLVSDEEFGTLTTTLHNLVANKYLKTDLPSFEEIKARIYLYDDYAEAIMMLTKYSII